MHKGRKKKRTYKKRPIVPKYIDFGFHKLKVELVSEKFMRDEAECEEGEETPEGLWPGVGSDDTKTKRGGGEETIYLLKTLSAKKMRYYLMHEMIHACLDLMDSLETGP